MSPVGGKCGQERACSTSGIQALPMGRFLFYPLLEWEKSVKKKDDSCSGAVGRVNMRSGDLRG